MARQDVEQQVLSELVSEAMEPFERLFTEQGRAVMHELLEDAFATHPVTAELLEQLLPAKVVQQSGKLGKEDAGALDDQGDGEQSKIVS
ncbi:MAG: hypothetical protein DRI90_19755 [Deltaproteobacteria bacterium]|nr:MAG: hypothetical protein DRI90_19755 [Deltaproteobacteria bacterium]